MLLFYAIIIFEMTVLFVQYKYSLNSCRFRREGNTNWFQNECLCTVGPMYWGMWSVD
jgi:hypothetical protein